MLKRMIMTWAIVAIWFASAVHETQGQVSEDSEAMVRRAAECLRRIPGLIEGKTPEDIANDNAHFVVLQVNRGQLSVPRTIIRFHRGVAQGQFSTISQSRITECMRGLRRLPPPN